MEKKNKEITQPTRSARKHPSSAFRRSIKYRRSIEVPKKLIMNWNLMDWKYAASARQGNETRYLVARAVTIFCWLFTRENIRTVWSARKMHQRRSNTRRIYTIKCQKAASIEAFTREDKAGKKLKVRETVLLWCAWTNLQCVLTCNNNEQGKACRTSTKLR